MKQHKYGVFMSEGRADTVAGARSAGGKRLFDLALAILLLPIVSIIVGILYVLVRLDGGPGFFGHRRLGRNGEVFRCWKLRTMVPDAEKVLAAHLRDNPEAAREWHRDFKLRDDPRITRLGTFLRETSLDELPQLWNVLRGEMSIVGPRPVVREELEKYRGYEWCYLACRPGITGLWQVSGRNDVDYASRVALDVQYATQASLARDVVIIFRTASAVLGRTGR
ncbi:sugar transferase [Palleronia sediminis]|uniref:Sugar transferase n=2 Tax=Palleronia sediminis TaxID=2547833 RepID=A0A4R6ADE3_9RHOB|nr:sugar transferase [Palleronia sediminis]